MSHDDRYCEPASRQALRICATTLLLLSVLINRYCSFAAAGNALPQSALAAATMLIPHEQVQNTPTNLIAIGSSASPAYPLKASANNRYLVDQNDVPFLMVGDSPQALIGNLSPMVVAFFMENRRRYGINALWINLLCNDGTACNSDGTTFDGIAPFTTANDLSTPNPAYFERADGIINLAAANGVVVILDPIETNGWLRTLRANGIDKAFVFGQYLGNRSQYHLDAGQLLSVMAKCDRRRIDAGRCDNEPRCYPNRFYRLFRAVLHSSRAWWRPCKSAGDWAS